MPEDNGAKVTAYYLEAGGEFGQGHQDDQKDGHCHSARCSGPQAQQYLQVGTPSPLLHGGGGGGGMWLEIAYYCVVLCFGGPPPPQILRGGGGGGVSKKI